MPILLFNHIGSKCACIINLVVIYHYSKTIQNHKWSLPVWAISELHSKV